MKTKLRIGLVPTRRVVFDARAAMEQKSILLRALRKYDVKWVDIDDVATDGIACDMGEVPAIVKKFKEAEVDGIFFPHMDFGTEFVVGKVASHFDVPLIVWGSPANEIVDGVLQRYTLCGMFATGKIIRRFGKRFDYIISCAAGSEVFDRNMETFFGVCRVLRAFNNMKVMQISTRPAPFWSVKYNEAELLERFKIDVYPVPLTDLVRDVKKTVSAEKDRVRAEMDSLKGSFITDGIADEQLAKAVAMRLVLEGYFETYGLSGAAIQCWSAMQEELGIMPCATFGLLCGMMMPIACETDVKGAVSSAMLQAAANEPVFFTDVTIPHPENENAVLLWHCGNFPSSMAGRGQKKLANHPIEAGNPAAVGEWALEEGGDITVGRFDEEDGVYYMMIGEGRSVPGPKVNGTYVWMEVKDWPCWENRLVNGPYIHHMSGVFAKAAPVMYRSCKYIEGLTPDLFSVSEREIDEYLRKGGRK